MGAGGTGNELERIKSWCNGIGCLLLALLILNRRRILESSNQIRLDSETSPKRPLTHKLLVLVFSASRLLRRLRRRIFFGREPKWASDVYGLVSYVNFLGLLPTFLSIAASPEHFFKRVPADGTSFDGIYKPPLKF